MVRGSPTEKGHVCRDLKDEKRLCKELGRVFGAKGTPGVKVICHGNPPASTG